LPAGFSFFNVHIGLRAFMTGGALRPAKAGVRGQVDLFLCIADHFEPQVGHPTPAVARARLEDWLRRYPTVATRHRDADGRPPAHSFFYPWDEYEAEEFRHLSQLCAQGWGEIELHLHHQDDTDASLRRKLREALQTYRQQGALSTGPDGRTAFGFIHGNWALDNSRCEGGRNYCGVNNELTVLQEEGCYADLTFPSWQHMSQPRKTNRIYYAIDDPLRPKSHDTGQNAQAGRSRADGLLMIQGPLVPYLEPRRLRPAMDDGDLASYRRYAPERLDRWVRAGIHVQGRPDCVFIKLHCHGAADKNREVLLGEDLEALFSDAETRYNDGVRYRLHYVTAREMFNVVKWVEAGEEGYSSAARDWLLPPPAAVPALSQETPVTLQTV
jgi:hypothetical protein